MAHVVFRALILSVALAVLGACNPAILIPPISKEKPWCYGDLGDGCPTDPPESQSYYVRGGYQRNANLTPPEWFQLTPSSPSYEEESLSKCRLVPDQGRD